MWTLSTSTGNPQGVFSMDARDQSGRDGVRRAASTLGAARSVLVCAFVAATTLCAAVGVRAYSGGSQDKPSPGVAPDASDAAIEAFWRAYHGNDYREIAQVEGQLGNAIQNDPNNPTLHALLGAAHF